MLLCFFKKLGIMSLSTKQDSIDGLEWGDKSFNLQSSGLVELPKRRQSQNPQPDPLPCPRCGSKNTKFCYYNNYNKLQPRHFCKACKRHWTKGGTLRNVPVGGGRKNKRPKTITTSTSASSIATANQSRQQMQSLSSALGDQKEDVFGILSQGPFGNNANSIFSGNSISTLPLFQNQMPPFTFSSSGPFEIERTKSLNEDSTLVGLASMEDTIPIIPSTTCFTSPTWKAPITSGGMDVPSYWNLDDVDPLVSVDQLNINWDFNHEIKP